MRFTISNYYVAERDDIWSGRRGSKMQPTGAQSIALKRQTFANGQGIAVHFDEVPEIIVGFGGRTPDQIVKGGEFEALRAHIQRRLAGDYT